MSARLRRTEPAAPVRIVHLGLGAFSRAHQAWFTQHAPDGDAWGIAAFTGRSPRTAEALAPQGGLYTLIERSVDGDTAEIMRSVVEVHDGADVERLVALVAAPATAVVTLTITEPAYRLLADGTPDPDDADVAADLAALRAASGAVPTGVRTPLVRLLAGLDARRRADAGPIAVVPCDNIPDNGNLVRTGLVGLARAVDAELAAWVAASVSVVATSVDRITPRATEADARTALELTGLADEAPVVTEPFRDWILCGEFPAGRPAWDAAGARIVDDIEPYERRKLWLLNAAHSLLAYAGLRRGHATVAEAMGDAGLRAAVRDAWDAAGRHLPAAELGLDAYRAALEERFDNARIEHRLEQIAMEGTTKLRVRFADVVLAERADGRDGAAGIRAIAEWIALLVGGREITDASGPRIADALASSDPVAALVALVDQRLAEADGVVDAVRAAAL